ncbi:hypothetical protein LXL04_039754 [Taraxacum kok-saghyz]
MPKSISVRSKGYMKSIPSQRPARQQVTTTPLGQSQRVRVPGEKKAGEGLEFEVYNQGMSKTELCNKWQETGACPYGDNLDYMENVEGADVQGSRWLLGCIIFPTCNIIIAFFLVFNIAMLAVDKELKRLVVETTANQVYIK